MEQQPRMPSRSQTDRIISGVCSGIAVYFGIAPWIVRVAMLLLATAGIGFVIYSVAWMLMPQAPGQLSVLEDIRQNGLDVGWRHARSRESNAIIGVAIFSIFIAVVLVLAAIPHLLALLPALALIGLGIYLLRPRQSSVVSPVASNLASEDNSGRTEQTHAATHLTGAYGTTPPPPKLRRDRDPLFAISNGAAIATFGILVVLAVLVDHFRPALLVGIPALILSIGTMVSALRGRGRLLAAETVALLLILTPIVYTQQVYADMPERGLSQRDGRGVIRIQDASQVNSTYQLRAGELFIDASSMQMNGAPVTINARLGAGEVVIAVPKGVNVLVNARAGLGQVDLFGIVQDGVGVDFRKEIKAETANQITINASTKLGEVTVTDDPLVIDAQAADNRHNASVITSERGTAL